MAATTAPIPSWFTEFRRLTDCKLLWMYDTKQFAASARQYTPIKVSDDSLADIDSKASISAPSASVVIAGQGGYSPIRSTSREAVADWIYHAVGVPTVPRNIRNRDMRRLDLAVDVGEPAPHGVSIIALLNLRLHDPTSTTRQRHRAFPPARTGWSSIWVDPCHRLGQARPSDDPGRERARGHRAGCFLSA